MEARLRQALARAEEVARALADPETARNPAKLKQLGREHARLDAIRQAHIRLEHLQGELAQAREVLQDKDPELSQLARADVERLRPEIERAQGLLADLLTPTDPLDDRDAIVEIRAGTGGDEAALFAGDLYGMYMSAEEPRTPEEIAEDFGLPLEAVRDAIAYCQSNPPEIEQDFRREEARMAATGMNDPNYKYHGKPKLLTAREIARLRRP